ncbi:MAG: hypothetical protein K0R67_2180, partial [Paenibacillus sp.]|nr:hypothetical protein [Paenibacillus sp.]
MPVGNSKGRLFAVVLSIAIVCAALSWGLSKWSLSKEETINDGRVSEQISSYLTALYALYGEWSPVIKQLESPQAEQRNALLNGIGRNVRIWSANNHIVWEPLTSASPSAFTEGAAKNRQILLLDRQVIGYF